MYLNGIIYHRSLNTCGVSVVQSTGSGYQNISIAHLSDIVYFAHLATCNIKLMVTFYVKHDDATPTAAAPQLLVDKLE